MSNKKLFVIVGKRCSGKTTISKYLANNYAEIQMIEVSNLLKP